MIKNSSFILLVSTAFCFFTNSFADSCEPNTSFGLQGGLWGQYWALPTSTGWHSTSWDVTNYLTSLSHGNESLLSPDTSLTVMIRDTPNYHPTFEVCCHYDVTGLAYREYSKTFHRTLNLQGSWEQPYSEMTRAGGWYASPHNTGKQLRICRTTAGDPGKCSF